MDGSAREAQKEFSPRKAGVGGVDPGVPEYCFSAPSIPQKEASDWKAPNVLRALACPQAGSLLGAEMPLHLT